MKALTWHGKRDVRVDDVPDPTIQEPDRRDRPRSRRAAMCGSDLHLYEVLGPFIDEGDILGHEPMGIVEEVGAEVTDLARRRPGRDPVQHLLRQLLDVRAGPAVAVRDDPGPRAGHGRGAVRLHQAVRQVPGGQAEYLRVPQAQYGPIKVPDGPPDERFVFLSDVLPTAWQAVEYADVPDGGHASPSSGSARSATWPPHRRCTGGHRGHRRRPGARAPRAGRAPRRRGDRPARPRRRPRRASSAS